MIIILLVLLYSKRLNLKIYSKFFIINLLVLLIFIFWMKNHKNLWNLIWLRIVWIMKSKNICYIFKNSRLILEFGWARKFCLNFFWEVNKKIRKKFSHIQGWSHLVPRRGKKKIMLEKGFDSWPEILSKNRQLPLGYTTICVLFFPLK